MNAEDRLRKAIADRTTHIEPAPDGLERIEEALMQPTQSNVRNRWVMGGVAAAAVLVVAVAAVWLRGGDDDSPEGVATQPETTTSVPVDESSVPTPSSTTTTEVPATTAPEPSATTTVPPPVVQVLAESVVWPRPGHEARFDDPVAAARSFARFYAGFADPVVGSFAAGDSRSGEVEVRPSGRHGAPVTTVLVRQMADDHWWVIGASSPDITIDDVGGDGSIECSGTVRITGKALAFEGHVDVRIDGFGADGSRTPLGQSFGTGAGSPPAAPFTAEVPCDGAGRGGSTDSGGVVMAWTDSAENGQRWQVTARPVSLRP